MATRTPKAFYAKGAAVEKLLRSEGEPKCLYAMPHKSNTTGKKVMQGRGGNNSPEQRFSMVAIYLKEASIWVIAEVWQETSKGEEKDNCLCPKLGIWRLSVITLILVTSIIL